MKRRSPGDPWYTVFYRDPYRWWVPAVVGLPLSFGVLRLLGESPQESLTVGLILGLLNGTFAFMRHDGSRE